MQNRVSDINGAVDGSPRRVWLREPSHLGGSQRRTPRYLCLTTYVFSLGRPLRQPGPLAAARIVRLNGVAQSQLFTHGVSKHSQEILSSEPSGVVVNEGTTSLDDGCDLHQGT